MSEEKTCNHWYHQKDADSEVEYCKECNVILTPSEYWSGELTIGQMKTNYEVDSTGLDFGQLVADHLGAKSIVIQKVWLVPGKYYTPEVDVYFTIENATRNILAAHINYSRMTRWTPTSEFFVAPETAESLTSEV